MIEDYQPEPCLRSGFCCKKAPCVYGERADNGWCKYLEEAGKIGDAPFYACTRYDWIKTQPGWEFTPAFGAGCSSTLFNEDRERIIRELRKILPTVGDA